MRIEVKGLGALSIHGNLCATYMKHSKRHLYREGQLCNQCEHKKMPIHLKEAPSPAVRDAAGFSKTMPISKSPNMSQSCITWVLSQLWTISSDSKKVWEGIWGTSRKMCPRTSAFSAWIGEAQNAYQEATGPKFPSWLCAPNCETSSFSFSLNLGCTEF